MVRVRGGIGGGRGRRLGQGHDGLLDRTAVRGGGGEGDPELNGARGPVAGGDLRRGVDVRIRLFFL